MKLFSCHLLQLLSTFSSPNILLLDSLYCKQACIFLQIFSIAGICLKEEQTLDTGMVSTIFNCFTVTQQKCHYQPYKDTCTFSIICTYKWTLSTLWNNTIWTSVFQSFLYNCCFITNIDSTCGWKQVDPDQLASLEASWSGSTLFSKEDIENNSQCALIMSNMT